jgi:hypothetical protein
MPAYLNKAKKSPAEDLSQVSAAAGLKSGQFNRIKNLTA